MMGESKHETKITVGCWNHRVMRKVFVSEHETVVQYGIVEAHYHTKGDKLPHSWTEEFMEPYGDTLPDLIKDFARMMAALSLPVLDHNGAEIEPAAVLADELQQWIDSMREVQGHA